MVVFIELVVLKNKHTLLLDLTEDYNSTSY